MTEFAVPPGDPATLRSAASALGGYATEHARQLNGFRAAVKTALAGWRGTLAEQYAVAAGQACARFAGVSETLKAGQAALNRYAGALEHAQDEVNGLNAAFASLPQPTPPGDGTAATSDIDLPDTKASLQQQFEAADDTLRAAQHSCAQALDQARDAMALSCPDMLSASQLLSLVKGIASHLTSPAEVHLLEYGLSSWALYADAVSGLHGAQAAEALQESQALAAVLAEDQLPAAAARLLDRTPDAFPLLRSWQNLTLQAEEERDAAQAAVELRGGSFTDPAAAAWTLNIPRWYDETRHGLTHEGDDIWDAPEEFANALRSAVDPVDW